MELVIGVNKSCVVDVEITTSAIRLFDRPHQKSG